MKSLIEFWRKLSAGGTSPMYSEELNSKIELANNFGLILLLLNVQYIVLLAFVSIYGSIALTLNNLLQIFCLYLIRNQQHVLGRILLNLSFSTIVAVCVLLFLRTEDTNFWGVISFYSLSIVCPFLLFTSKERIHVYILSAVIAITIFSIPQLPQLIDVKINSDLLNTNIFQYIALSSACIGYILMLLLNDKSLSNESRMNQKYVQQIQSLNEEIIKTESDYRKAEETNRINELNNQRRKWLNDGNNGLVEKLNSINQHDTLYDEFNKYIYTYCQAEQSALYVIQNNLTHLELKSKYAFFRKKHSKQIIAIDNGYVGETYRKGRTFIIKNIQDQYYYETSGIDGKSYRIFIVTVPIKDNHSVLGVIEIALVNEPDEFVLEFLDNAGAFMAGLIASINNSEKINQLLLNTKEQTEKLSMQEEELRQNLEEMSATQEEMGRKEIEYLRTIQKLEEELEK